MKPKLLVEEYRTHILVTMITDDDFSFGSRVRTRLWAHPDVVIGYARYTQRSNYEAVANAIMNALQDAGLPVSALRYYGMELPRKRISRVDKSQGRLL
jgi:hypothetical protein